MEYHLTPRGWEPGMPPRDRVETWTKRVERGAGLWKEYIRWVCNWADPDRPRAERDALRAAHQRFMGKPGRRGTRRTTIGRPL